RRVCGAGTARGIIDVSSAPARGRTPPRPGVMIAPQEHHEPDTMKATERDELLRTLQARFEANPHRHRGIAWSDVESRLLESPAALRSLQAMEETGGEPDVIGRESGTILICDCSPESPRGRRSICYDGEARRT